MKRFLTLAVLAAACASCSRKPLKIADGCNPLLAGYDCFLPYPSDYYRVADSTSATGYSVKTTGAAKLVLPPDGSTPGVSADISDFRPIDGYSILPAIQAVLPSAISATGFVGLLDDAKGSLAVTSNMILIEADTGTLVPTWVDLDPRAADPKHQAIVMHPLVALKYTTRYVVALHGVQTPTGSTVAAPEGFRRIRDSQSSDDPTLKSQQAHYDQDIFPIIATAGVARSSLQLAWDFTTGDEAQADGDMFEVRTLAMQWLATNTPTVTITSVQEYMYNDSWRVIQGTVSGPLYDTTNKPGSVLFRDASGKVAQNGMTTFTFTANVPISVRDQFDSGRTVSYGHGFFGDQSEVIDSETRPIAQVLKSVFFCIDWWGMSGADAIPLATNLLKSPSNTMQFTERVPQAMVNWIVLNAAIRGPLLQQAAFLRPASGLGVSMNSQNQSNAGMPVLDGQTNYYLGISQGAILGTALAAFSPDFKQIVLNVGGAGFTQLMWRAVPFNTFLQVIEDADPDPLDQQKLTGTLQVQFDRIDPNTYAPHVLTSPLAGSPQRRVLMQNGLGDLEVPNMGNFLLARQLGVPEISPNDFAGYLVDQTPGPVSGSAMTIWDFGIDLTAAYAKAEPAMSDNNPVHDGVRKQPTALVQMDTFFQPNGAIINPCDGGACKATDAGLNEELPDAGVPDASETD